MPQSSYILHVHNTVGASVTGAGSSAWKKITRAGPQKRGTFQFDFVAGTGNVKIEGRMDENFPPVELVAAQSADGMQAFKDLLPEVRATWDTANALEFKVALWP